MNIHRQLYVVASVAALVAGNPVAQAEEHIQDVLQHADQAAHSTGDSQAIRQHSREALDLIDEAKEANASHSEVVKLIDRSEEELNSAVSNASRFNSNRAIEDATDAKKYLEAADKAADQAKEGPWPIERKRENP